MDWTLEVVILPVSDIDRSVAFYRDQVGFHLDHDTKTDQMHVVQLTPRGSGCSIVIVATPVPTTAGIRYSRATTAQWLRTPPVSVTTAAAVPKSGVHGGAVVTVTMMSPG